ncbi:hypothetical protein PAQ31011_02669 [Pandoraea aquatica]|uniref:Uncharacterized protein n=1 Tax=Pandoraea aquatica TaxID=2508290 RepID=A0A5E4VHU6_9BURK|nr:hypothetical protein PAQ31011_02669 [Pandoraea aquatica]
MLYVPIRDSKVDSKVATVSRAGDAARAAT